MNDQSIKTVRAFADEMLLELDRTHQAYNTSQSVFHQNPRDDVENRELYRHFGRLEGLAVGLSLLKGDGDK